MTKNMTTGSPFKLIMSFALPLLLGNLLQQTYNLIDAAIVGRFLGSDALASVGATKRRCARSGALLYYGDA